MIIKNMASETRPREKALKYGISNLSTDELLAILLRTGYKGCSSRDVANNILIELNNFKDYKDISINRISKIKGVGIAKALTILSAIELGNRINVITNTNLSFNTSDKIFNYFKNRFINNKQEEFIVVLLDQKKRLIEYKTIFKGDLNSVNIHPREIFKYAIVNSSSSIIVLHNHPSGDSTPSKQDIVITQNLVDVGKTIQIPVIDHIIIGDNNYYSFFSESTLMLK